MKFFYSTLQHSLIIAALMHCGGLVGCFHPEGQNRRSQGGGAAVGGLRQNQRRNPVASISSSKAGGISNKKQPQKGSVAAQNCLSYQGLNKPFPMWFPEHGFMVTRMLHECTTEDGFSGYRAQSPFVAMGIPCSGGGGRVNIGGHYWIPQIVSFSLTTDCSMQSESLEHLTKEGRSSLRLSQEAKAVALNPFAVQYWELPGLEEADTGFNVELRSAEAKQQLWRPFLEKKPIPVDLYGRENAWVRGRAFFHVRGELHHTGTKSFKLKVVDIKTLSPQQVYEVKNRCESLQPARNCHQVFS